MATITPAQDMPFGGTGGVVELVWETLTPSDTAAEQETGGSQPIAGAVQVVGTFSGSTVVLQASNDGTNWVTLKDVTGTDISFTSTGMAEFSTAALYIRPSISGGSGDVDVIVVLRG